MPQYNVTLTRTTIETFSTTTTAESQDEAIALANQQAIENDTFEPQFQEISGEAFVNQQAYTPISSITQPRQPQQEYTSISSFRQG